MTEGSTDYDDGFKPQATPFVGGVTFRLNERSTMENPGPSKDALLESLDQSVSILPHYNVDKYSR